MDKVFKIKKNDLVNNFKIACDKLDYKDVEFNPVTNSITYKALGKGLQWGTNAVVKVVFTEKEGFTNASFGIIKEIRFPKFGKQKLAENFSASAVPNVTAVYPDGYRITHKGDRTDRKSVV
jgi:hypothetical protein